MRVAARLFPLPLFHVATHSADLPIMPHAAILGGEACASLAGGINGLLWHETTVGICQLQALSPMGRCQSFDAAADGYGRGEGFAIVFVTAHERKSGADRPLLAHLHGSAVNQDGRSSSLTAPNGPAQQLLLATALASGGLEPWDVGFVVVHGTGELANDMLTARGSLWCCGQLWFFSADHCSVSTGTPLGDPIEVGALAVALGGHSAAARVLSLVSVKSCYGHTEGTAGLTGLLLAAAGAAQQALPPVVNLREMNSYVSAALGGFDTAGGAAVPRQAGPATSADTRSSSAGVLAGTSSFGMSGVNAHMLLSASGPVWAEGASCTWALPWEQRRYWPVPPAHRLLQLPRLQGGDEARFAASITATATLAYLWDHSVAGRALLAGTAMLEMAAAAAATLADAALPTRGTGVATKKEKAAVDRSAWQPSLPAVAVAGAAFVGACVLPPASSGKALLLECGVSGRSGGLLIQSTSSASGGMVPHVTAQAALAPQQQHHMGPMVSRMAPGPSLASLLLCSAFVPAAGFATTVSAADVAVPMDDTGSAYYQHPAAADATLHMSALASQELGGGMTGGARIPVAAGLFVCSSRVSSSGPAVTVVAVSLPNAEESLTATICRPARPSQQPTLEAGGFSLQHLLARSVGRRPSSQQQEQQLYSVKWQVAAAAAATAGSSLQQNLLSTELASGRILRLISGAGLLHAHPAQPCMQLLHALQSGTGGRHVAMWLLSQRESIATASVDHTSEQQCRAAMASSALHAMLCVAAAEKMLDPAAAVLCSSGRAVGAVDATTAASLGAAQFGVVQEGGALFAPRLLPAVLQQVNERSSSSNNAAHLRCALITGGLGGLGLLTANWLTHPSGSCGSLRHVALLGRSGHATGSLAGSPIYASEAAVTILRCDVGMAEEAAAAVSATAAAFPLSAVLHAGGVLADAAMANQTAARFRLVAAPKLAGLERLGSAASVQPLFQTLLFSSIAGALGTAGQAPYAAANASLDRAAALLQQRGASSTSMQWGAWASVGMAAAEPALLRRLAQQGYGAVQPAAGLTALQDALRPGAAAAVMASPFDWARFLSAPSRQALPFYSGMLPAPSSASSFLQTEATATPSQAYTKAAPPTPSSMNLSAIKVLHILGQLLVELTGVQAEPEMPLLEAGLDSIGAVELRWVFECLWRCLQA